MIKLKINFIKLTFVLILSTAISCSEKNEIENSNNSATEQKTKLSDLSENYLLELGKKQKEIPVDIVSTDSAFYVIYNTEASYGPKSDYKNYHGGYHDIVITKVDFEGKKIWTKLYGTELSDEAKSAYVTDSGNIVISGCSTSKSYYAGSIGPLIGSQKRLMFKIQSNGNISWKKGFDNSMYKADIDEVIEASFLKNDILYQFYSKNYEAETYLEMIDVKSGNTMSDSRSGKMGEHVPKLIKKNADGSFLMISNKKYAKYLSKLNSNLNLKWEQALGRSAVGSIRDIIETEDGILMCGSTGKGYYGINGTTFPYNRVIHEPVMTKGYEVYLFQTDKEGKFKPKQWTAQENSPTSVGWQIGIGYLESGWATEYKGVYRQNDSGSNIFKIKEDKYLIIGTGVKHKGKESTKGDGDYAEIEHGTLLMEIAPSYKMKDEKKGDLFIDWEKQFFKHVLKSKSFKQGNTNIKTVKEIGEVYLLLGEKGGNILVSILKK